MSLHGHKLCAPMIVGQQRSGLTLLSSTGAVEGQRRTVVCQTGIILVEQLPQPFLNAGRSVFAQEFEHQAVERLHANLKRLVAHPQHVALNALHVVHYASLTKPGHATIKPVLRICLEAAAAEVAIGPISGIVDDGLPSFADRRKICDDAMSR
jgi:hypothetical protein